MRKPRLLHDVRAIPGWRQGLRWACCRPRARHRCAALLLGGLVLWAAVPELHAAQLTRLQLVVDGSVEPPGDRLDLEVRFAPGQSRVNLEVRAYRVSGENNAQVTPVAARGAEQRDAAGHFLLRQSLIAAEGLPDATGTIVIAYQQLDLPEGLHQLAYELRGFAGDQLQFARPTALTKVTITQQTRRSMLVERSREVRSQSVSRTQALMPGERTRGGESTLERRELLVETETQRPVSEMQAVEVDIPGEYRREAPAPSAPAPDADADNRTLDLQGLQDQPWEPLADVEAEWDRFVYYATNRAEVDGGEGVGRFGDEVSPRLSYGKCRVNIPVQQHRRGQLERPSWWQSRNPDKHFLVESVVVLPRQAFFDHLQPNDLLLFVHGYRNSFEDTMLRAAQLRYDMDFSGSVATFSWPSVDSLTGYTTDAQHAEQSVLALADVLAGLIDRQPTPEAGRAPRRIHIIAHSMGNRVLLGAVYQLHSDGRLAPEAHPFGQVVLAAPDVGAIQFNNLLPYLIEASQRVTYYYCSHDAALAASRQLNYYEPVGMFAYFDDALDTISADGVDTSFLSHGYYASAREVLQDIRLMLLHRLSPGDRMPPLATVTEVFGHRCWSFTPVQLQAAPPAP